MVGLRIMQSCRTYTDRRMVKFSLSLLLIACVGHGHNALAVRALALHGEPKYPAGFKHFDYVIINDDLNVAAECLKAAIIAKKLQTKTALEAITAMAERLKEERDGRFARGH